MQIHPDIPPTPVLRYSEEPDSSHPSFIVHRSHLNSRGGFSFTEILFAVIVLGIGFIMIAAIFPVAIQQGKLTSEQGSATGVAREALNYLGQVGANSDAIPYSAGGPLFPATGNTGGIAPFPGVVYSFRGAQVSGSTSLDANQSPSNDPLLMTPAPSGRTADELWNRLNLSLVVPSDERFAFVGMYKRDGNPADRRTWSPFVQVWFIPVTTRTRSTYTPGTLTNPSADVTGNTLQGRLVKVSIDLDWSVASLYSPTPANVANFSPSSVSGYVLYSWSGLLSEGCYVIIANDQIVLPAPVAPALVSANQGHMNGHIYHVGQRRPDLDYTVGGGKSVTAYDLAPDGGFAPDPGADGLFGANPPPTGPDDDILTIGMQTDGSTNPNPEQPFNGTSPYGNASGPADAYIVSPDQGVAPDISAFTTFIKVN